MIRLSVMMMLALILLLLLPGVVIADEDVPTREALTETLIREKFFRNPVGVLWTYFGEGSRSYAFQVRHGFVSNDVLPNPFGQLGLIPSAVVGDIIYESSPSGEKGDAIWSEATAFYDELFDCDWLEGRVIYRDIILNSYLGAGLGYTPVHNSWVGGYYLGSEGWQLEVEAAKALSEQFWLYGSMQYYTQDEAVEGDIGLIFDDIIYLSVENRGSEWVYKMGAAYLFD